MTYVDDDFDNLNDSPPSRAATTVLDPEPSNPEVEGDGTLATISKSELTAQQQYALQHPRSIKAFRHRALEMATLTEDIASECIYAVPRDGKTIEGPSARFAEILHHSWGNCRAGARKIGEDAEFVTSQGVFHDIETNSVITYEVSRRITNKNGKRYNSDMISTTTNAASSIALRNAVLKGIPKALWVDIYQAARKTAVGDQQTLANRRAIALDFLQKMGATQDMVFQTLQVQGVEDITLDHLLILKGLATAIKEGETTVEQAFAPPNREEDVRLKSGATERIQSIKDRHQNPPPPASQSAPSPASPSGAEAADTSSTGSSTLTPVQRRAAEEAQAKIDAQARPSGMKQATEGVPGVEGLFPTDGGKKRK